MFPRSAVHRGFPTTRRPLHDPVTPTDPTFGQQIRRFEREHARNPGGLAFARLAEAYRRARRASRALELLRDGLRRHPSYPAGHLVRARALADLGRLDEAGASFRRVLELDPGNLVALRALARLSREQGDAEQERQWIRKIRGAHPSAIEPSDAAGAAGRRATEPEGDEGGSPPPASSRKSRSVREILDRSAGDEPDDPPRSAAHSREERERLIEELSGVAHPGWWSDTGGDGGEGGGSEGGADGTAGVDREETGVVTPTMARLYAQQGYWDEAEALYEELTRRRPDDPALRHQLEEVRSREVPAANRGVDPGEVGDDAAREVEGDRTGTGAGREGRVEARAESMEEHLRSLLDGRAGTDAPPGGPQARPQRRPNPAAVDPESDREFREEGGGE